MSTYTFEKPDQKIAVFCTDSDWVIHACFHPRSQFVRIKSREDVLALSFTGIVAFSSSLLTYDQKKAFQHLKYKQPDLFK